MDVATTKHIILNAPRNSIMLAAKHGVGKSSVVWECAKEMNGLLPDAKLAQTDKNKIFKDIRLSQCEVGDIKGLPFRVTKTQSVNGVDQEVSTVVYAKPDWFPTDPDSKGILFFDELNRAPKDVLQAVFEICLDRTLDGVKLPDGWVVVAAINASDDYDVMELDPALHDRWFHISFKPSVEEWLDWASQNQIHQSITQFIGKFPQFLDPPVGSMEAGKIYPSRRSWHAFAGWFDKMQLLSDTALLVQVCKGWLGQEIATSYQKFVSSDFSMLGVEDVLDTFEDHKDEIERSCDDIEVVAMLAKTVVKEINKRSAKQFGEKQKDNFYKFFLMLPHDVAADTWNSVLGGRKSKKLMARFNKIDGFKTHIKCIFVTS